MRIEPINEEPVCYCGELISSHSAGSSCTSPREMEQPKQFKVSYYISGFIHNEIVDERTARLLERAKEAGRVERSKEIRKLIDA
jgi:hypothetical protein